MGCLIREGVSGQVGGWAKYQMLAVTEILDIFFPEEQMKTYKSTPIKRKRRTKPEMERIKGALYSILDNDHPQTCRGVFYQATTRGIVEKTETEYKNTVTRLLGTMRKSGILPFEWLSDSTRWMRKPRSYSNLEEALHFTHQYYRRAVWNDLPVYVETWCEKEALAGVIYEETAKWDVPLMVTRGYPSLSFLYTAADAIRSYGKPTYIYYLGDYDPRRSFAR